MQQGVQTDATRNIQQCWELLVNNVASVCTQPKSPEERKSAKFGQAACLDEDSWGTDADADLPVEANPPPHEPKQDKAKKKCSRKRQRKLEEFGRPFVSKLWHDIRVVFFPRILAIIPATRIRAFFLPRILAFFLALWGFYSQVYDHFLTNAHIYAHKKIPYIYALQTRMCIWGHRKSSYKRHRIIPSAKNPSMYDGAEK